jgi:hypothetical protein
MAAQIRCRRCLSWSRGKAHRAGKRPSQAGAIRLPQPPLKIHQGTSPESPRIGDKNRPAVRKAHDEKAALITTDDHDDRRPKPDSSEREFRAAAPDTASNIVTGCDDIRPFGFGTCGGVGEAGEARVSIGRSREKDCADGQNDICASPAEKRRAAEPLEASLRRSRLCRSERKPQDPNRTSGRISLSEAITGKSELATSILNARMSRSRRYAALGLFLPQIGSKGIHARL